MKTKNKRGTINVDKILNEIKLQKSRKDFEEAIGLHLIIDGYKPAKRAKIFNWDTFFYCLSCCLLSAILTTVILQYF